MAETKEGKSDLKGKNNTLILSIVGLVAIVAIVGIVLGRLSVSKSQVVTGFEQKADFVASLPVAQESSDLVGQAHLLLQYNFTLPNITTIDIAGFVTRKQYAPQKMWVSAQYLSAGQPQCAQYVIPGFFIPIALNVPAGTPVINLQGKNVGFAALGPWDFVIARADVELVNHKVTVTKIFIKNIATNTGTIYSWSPSAPAPYLGYLTILTKGGTYAAFLVHSNTQILKNVGGVLQPGTTSDFIAGKNVNVQLGNYIGAYGYYEASQVILT